MPLSPSILGPCISDRRLSLILLPTEVCNFRCVYCYESSEHGLMKAAVVDGINNLLSCRAPDLEELSLSWFGGEPLLAPKVVEKVQRHALCLLGEYPRIRFNGAMTTNAYLLTREVFESLLELGVKRFQIAFDGPRRWHNRKRVLPNGQGTFDRIWKNVTTLKDVPAKFTVILRLHVDRDNMDAIPDFLELAGEAFAGDSRFEIFIRPLSRLGGPNDDQLCTLDGGSKNERIALLKELVASLGLGEYSGEGHFSPCYAAKANSFVIRADGRINKCSVVMEHPGNQVGHLNRDGTMSLDTPRILEWIRGIVSEIREELHCPLIGFHDPHEMKVKAAD